MYHKIKVELARSSVVHEWKQCRDKFKALKKNLSGDGTTSVHDGLKVVPRVPHMCWEGGLKWGQLLQCNASVFASQMSSMM